jgi:lipopolysaccharide biosynthesis protein
MTEKNKSSVNTRRARVLAFYLPQFHPTPENDEWWGKGFTEWTNVAKAKPLYRGHHQPNIPSDLGFYDLRVPETRIAQAKLAEEHGIEGFCYWHYWFSGKRILERPFTEVLKSKEPDFPFCLGWANATWTGIWHGSPDRILIRQEYPGVKDYENHFYALLDAFTDDRYITIDGKPVFIIFRPEDLPDSQQFTDLWRNLAVKEGLKGIYLIGRAVHMWSPDIYGFDACCVDYFLTSIGQIDSRPRTVITKKMNRLFAKPDVYSYRDIIRHSFHSDLYNDDQYPCVIPNWDNTPRSSQNGVVFKGSSPDLFKLHLDKAIRLMRNRPLDKRLLFIKSWNEWAEGNYIEPDQRFGKQYLQAIKENIYI